MFESRINQVMEAIAPQLDGCAMAFAQNIQATLALHNPFNELRSEVEGDIFSASLRQRREAETALKTAVTKVLTEPDDSRSQVWGRAQAEILERTSKTLKASLGKYQPPAHPLPGNQAAAAEGAICLVLAGLTHDVKLSDDGQQLVAISAGPINRGLFKGMKAAIADAWWQAVTHQALQKLSEYPLPSAFLDSDLQATCLPFSPAASPAALIRSTSRIGR